MGDEIAADVWLKAGDDTKALNAATLLGKSLVLAKIRLAITERRMESGDITGAKSMLQAMAATLPALNAGNQFDRITARQRIRLIHLFAKAGDVKPAEQLASSYPGPGWRGFAYSVIVATTNREHSGPDSGGPFLDLQEVSAEH